MNDYPFVSATEARNSFADTFNNSIYVKPQHIKKSKNNALLIKQEEIFKMLDSMKIDVTISKEDNQYIASTNNDDILESILGWGNTKEEAIDSYVDSLDAYAHMYYDSYESITKTEKGIKEMPYIFKVMCASSLENVKRMLKCHDGKN